MNIRVLDKVTTPGVLTEPNEDHLMIEDGLVVVLDGATGLGSPTIASYSSDALWLVENMASALAAAWKKTRNFRPALMRALESCMSEYSKHVGREHIAEYLRPSAGMVAIAVEGERVGAFRFGDCKAYVSDSVGEKRVFGVSPLEALDTRAIEAMSAERRSGKSAMQARKAIEPMLKEHRSFMNKPEGYGALALSPECLKYLEYAELSQRGRSTVLLATDGFHALEQYKNYDVTEFMRVCGQHSLSELARCIRAIEEEDIERVRYPRFKVHDDATAVLLSIDGAE